MPERAKAVSVPEAEKWLGLFYQGSDLKLGHLLETFFFPFMEYKNIYVLNGRGRIGPKQVLCLHRIREQNNYAVHTEL
jgi:hypothetical protein